MFVLEVRQECLGNHCFSFFIPLQAKGEMGGEGRGGGNYSKPGWLGLAQSGKLMFIEDVGNPAVSREPASGDSRHRERPV